MSFQLAINNSNYCAIVDVAIKATINSPDSHCDANALVHALQRYNTSCSIGYTHTR